VTDDEAQKLLTAIRQENAAAHGETRRHFDETADRLASTMRHQFEVSTEALKHDIQLVAEGLIGLGERVSREIGRLDEKMDQGFANTRQ
jgi:hypothetical protein